MSRIIFSSQKITQHVTRILDGSDVCEYLIEGNEKALLIDTGYGIGDLKGFVDTLTKKPYEVYMTHAHVDHGGGAYAFGKVHLHHRDQEPFQDKLFTKDANRYGEKPCRPENKSCRFSAGEERNI